MSTRDVWIAFLTLGLAGCTDGGGEGEGEADGTASSLDSSGGVDTTTTSATGETGSSGGVDESGSSSTGDLPEPLPPLDAAPLTTDETIVPVHAIDPAPVLDVRIVAELEQAISDGYGEIDLAAGEPIVDVTPDMMPPPAAGPNAATLVRFVHLADAQLADDESPTRAVAVDNPVLSGGFRPQEHFECQILNAAVRTINAVNAATPLDFVILGGDNADSAQRNELEWFTGILDGAPVIECDSGIDTDIVPGPDNDPKDPFAPVGLDVPWRWVTGNHDALVQGNFVIDGYQGLAVGTEVPTSTRDWTMPGGPETMGPVAADERRELVDAAGLLDLLSASGDGHGIGDEAIAYGRAFYTFDVPDTPLRFVVIDTSAATGSADGLMIESDVDGFVRPALDAAEADGKWVILASHHASSTFTDGGGLGGTEQATALTTVEWRSVVGEYTNVLMHMAGHSHEHLVEELVPTGGDAYWEVRTAALADWPHQMRWVEIRDEDNGFLSITLVAVDFSTQGDGIAADGRVRGVTDYTAGWLADGAGMVSDRNVRLWIAVP